MITFEAIIKKFDKQGEKTGWTYIEIPETVSGQLMPGNKKAFRVKGRLAHCTFEGVSLLPMGGGNFIMALNGGLRKKLLKPVGALIRVNMDADTVQKNLSPELLVCLTDEPDALAHFNTLPPSHRLYFSNWIESAKTEMTKARRKSQAVTACLRGQHYGEMIRSLKGDK